MLSSAEVLEASWQKPSHLWVQTLKAKVCPVDELQRTRLPMRSSMATRYSRFFGTTTNRAVQKHFLRWRKICLVYKSNDGYPTERRLSLSKDPNPMLFVVNLSATLEPRNRKSLQIVLDVLSVEVLSYCSLRRGLIIGNLYIKQRACLDVYRPDNFFFFFLSPNSWAGVQSMIVVGSGSESTHWGEDTNLINV